MNKSNDVPVCNPMRSCNGTPGKCFISKLPLWCSRSNAIVAICSAWSGERTGSPLTTIYASPIVSTLYTLYALIVASKHVYKSFNRSTTWTIYIYWIQAKVYIKLKITQKKRKKKKTFTWTAMSSDCRKTYNITKIDGNIRKFLGFNAKAYF